MYTVFYMCKRVTAHTPRRFGLFIWRKRITNGEWSNIEYRKNTGSRVVLLVVCLVAAIGFRITVKTVKYICIIKKIIYYQSSEFVFAYIFSINDRSDFKVKYKFVLRHNQLKYKNVFYIFLFNFGNLIVISRVFIYFYIIQGYCNDLCGST